MNIYVLFWLMMLLAPGGSPMYTIDLSTLEVPNDFQNELTLQSMLSSEMQHYRNTLNRKQDPNQLTAAHQAPIAPEDASDRRDFLRSIDDRIKASYYAVATRKPFEEDDEHQTKFSRCTYDGSQFLGTNLFGDYAKRCFSMEDIALMSARRDFELLIPKSYPQHMLNDAIVYTLMRYFNSINHLVKRMPDMETRRLLQRAFYDALGGYLRFYLLPVAQVSFYAGRLKLCTVERLVALYRQCQVVLNTNGNGWKTPVADILSQLKGVTIQPLRVNENRGSERDAAFCAMLDQNCMNEDEQREQMLVALPHLEAEDSSGFLSNIFLPFKHRRIYNLRSPDTGFILVKFYKALISCYRFQGVSPKTYNQKLRNWIRENLQLHYRDEMFYPGLGGVLQIYEALTNVDKTGAEDCEEHMISEEDFADYHTSIDNDKKVKGKKKCRKTKKKKGKSRANLEASRKQCRSPMPGEDQAEAAPEQDQSEEECVDCTDSRYMVYVAAFFASLFGLLIMILCCCLRWRRKLLGGGGRAGPPPRKPSPVPTKSDKSLHDEESTSNEAEDRKGGCWSFLFKRRKKKESPKKKPQGKSNYYDSPSPGLGLMGTQRNQFLKAPAECHAIQEIFSRKKRYHDESLTSTSSLGCELPRKIIPIKGGRTMQEYYYGKREKKLEKLKEKERKKERNREREAAPTAPKSQTASEVHLPIKQNPIAVNSIVHLSASKVNFARQTGGLTQITSEQTILSESEMQKDINCYRDKVSLDNMENKEQRSFKVTNNLSATVTEDLPKTELPQIAESTESVAGDCEAVISGESWETILDDDSK